MRHENKYKLIYRIEICQKLNVPDLRENRSAGEAVVAWCIAPRREHGVQPEEGMEGIRVAMVWNGSREAGCFNNFGVIDSLNTQGI